MSIYVPGRLTLRKEFQVQDYMWLFPEQYGLWSPAEITTALWLDAADSSTITQSGGAVSQWNDKSGNDRHVLQSNSALRPVATAAGQNGLGVITFNNKVLSTISNFPLTGNAVFSIFVAYKKTVAANGSVLGWGNANSSLQAVGFFDNNTNLIAWAYASGNNYNVAQVSIGSPLILGYTKAAGAIDATSNAYRNGSVDGTSGHSTSTPNVASQPFSIGQWSNFTSNRLNGDIYEVVILDSVASTADRQRIEGYLAHKWGLTANLPSDHPYKTVGPRP